MGKPVGCYIVLFLILLLAVPQELAAQDFLPRTFRIGKYKRYSCGKMEAYNQKAAYKKHKSGSPKKMTARLITKPTDKPVATQTKTPARRSPPPHNSSTSTSTTSTPVSPPRQPTAGKTPAKPTPPAPEPSPLIAKVPPTGPKKLDTTAVVKKSVPPLTREMLRKMTLQERRDTLRQIPPEIVLPPIQFISDQDEFSVVNMDSFMQAMEYAQQGKIVLIEGHTDDLGSETYNLKLSIKRSEKIRQLLISGDVSDELISVIGYGESQPVVPNTSAENRSINRRIEFKIFSVSE